MNYKIVRLFVLFLVVNIKLALSLYSKTWNENNKCPKLYPKNFDNHMPVGKYLYFQKIFLLSCHLVIFLRFIFNCKW